MAQNPTVIFVPGAWHVPEHFEPVVRDLKNHGFPAFAVALPSVGGPVTSFSPDVEAIISALVTVLDQGKDVIMVFHSYGGMPGSEAVGKVMQARQEPGKTRGKIRHLVYMSSYVPLEGQVIGSVCSNAPEGLDPDEPVEEWEVQYWDYHNGFMVPNSRAPDYWFEDMSAESAARAQSLVRNHAAAAFTFSKVTAAGWRFVPSTFVYARDDKAISLSDQEFMVRQARKKGGRENEVVPFDGPLGEFYLNAGHCSLLMDKAEAFSKVIRSIN